LVAAVLQGLVWLGEPEPAQAGVEVTQLPKRHKDNQLTETSHHQRQARSAREREATTTFSRADGLNGGHPPADCVFSGKLLCRHFM
jgi:hypothetical protein